MRRRPAGNVAADVESAVLAAQIARRRSKASKIAILKQLGQPVPADLMSDDEPMMALRRCGSHEVASTIVCIGPQLDDRQLLDALREHWTRCDAHRPYRAALIPLFKRAGFVTDDPERRLVGELTIYRGNLGEREPIGMSWTLDRAKAEWFAHEYLSGERAPWLGLSRRGARPTVWSARVRADHLLGYFNDREEQEVIVDPRTLYSVKRSVRSG